VWFGNSSAPDGSIDLVRRRGRALSLVSRPKLGFWKLDQVVCGLGLGVSESGAESLNVLNQTTLRLLVNEHTDCMLRDRQRWSRTLLHLHDPKGPVGPSGDMRDQFLIIPIVMSKRAEVALTLSLG
jgi:hypothetical protein